MCVVAKTGTTTLAVAWVLWSVRLRVPVFLFTVGWEMVTAQRQFRLSVQLVDLE